MPPRLRSAIPLAVLALLLAAPLYAQEPPARPQDPLAGLVGRPVRSVTLRVEGQVETTPVVLELITIRAGAPLRAEDVATSTSRLGEIFEDVNVVVLDASAPALDLVYDVLPIHPVDRFQAQGDTGVSQGELEDQLQARFLRLTTGRTQDAALRVLVEYLAEEGFAHAVADVAVHRRHEPEHRSTYIFTVQAGRRSRIVDLQIDNRSELGDGRVRDLLDVSVGGPFRLRVIQAGEAAIRDELRRRRFYAAEVTVTSTLLVDDDWTVSVVIDPGPEIVLRWADDGDAPPRGDIEDHVPIAFVGAVDDDVLAQAQRNIEATLRNEGYRDARVSYTRDTAVPGRQTITFKVTRGPRYVIRRITIPDGLFLERERILALLALETGSVRNESAERAARARVAVEYLALGFYNVDVRLDPQAEPTILPSGEAASELRLIVTEGPRGVVRTIRFEGIQAIPEPLLRAAMTSREGGPYLRGAAAADEYALETLYHDRGFLSAIVGQRSVIDEGGTAIDLVYQVQEGVQAIVADIQVVGNRQVSEATILEDITLRVGEPYGASARIESMRQLNLRGVFRRALIEELQRPPADPRAHVIITVIESPAAAIGVGGGIEVDERQRVVAGGGTETILSIAPRGFFDISRRNLGGRNRTLSFFSRVALKPASLTESGETGSRFGFPEYRLASTFSERRAFGTNTDLLFGATLEQAVRTGFNFSRKTFNAETQRFLRPGVSLSGRYVLNFTELFDEGFTEDEGRLIDRLFPQVRLSVVSTGMLWDRRNNALAPTRGELTTADVEFASEKLGSQVGYVKMYVQTSAFRALDRAGRFVLALRGQLGLARGFERTVIDESGETQISTDLPASQRFFAGGTTSVRGFQIDLLGRPDVFTNTGIPLGGNAVFVGNVELRTGLGRLFGRDLALATFVDGGNVFRRVSDLNFGRLRGAGGFGVQYNSPLGPLRLDFGFKFRRELLGGRLERGWEYHLNLGQVF